MKKQYAFLFLFLIAMMASVSAQSTTDTVYIPGAQSLNISNIVNADTSVTAPRVYVLDRGAIYYIDRAFELTHSSKFIAKGDATKRPPVLAPAIRADDTSEEWYFKMIKQNISLEIHNLYLLSLRSDLKTLGWSRAIHIGASNTSLKLRGVIFDGWTEAGIRVDGADFVKMDVQDCHFRNFTHGSSYFGGQPFLSNHNDHPDTTIFINNTFFACNSYLFSVRGLGPKSVFDHNTIVYTAVNSLLTRQADNLWVNNNIFYAAHAWGGDPEQRIGAWFLNYPDTVTSSIILFRENIPYYSDYYAAGPEGHYTDLGLTYDPTKKVTVIRNNVHFNPEKLTKFYSDWNDTVKAYDSVEVISGPKQYLKRELKLAPWLYDFGKMVRDSMTNPSSRWYSPTVNFQDAMEVDPQFTDAKVVGHIDSLVNYVKRIATRKLDNRWDYEFNFPPKWPLQENLTYSNTSLIHGGTDGYALGDLNWFPDQKATYVVGVETISKNVPEQYKLSQNYPNPFNPETKIEFNIAKEGYVKVVVYNILGQKIRTLLNQDFKAGSYSVTWNGKDDFGRQVSTGAYLYSLETESFKSTKKMILMK